MRLLQVDVATGSLTLQVERNAFRYSRNVMALFVETGVIELPRLFYQIDSNAVESNFIVDNHHVVD